MEVWEIEFGDVGNKAYRGMEKGCSRLETILRCVSSYN